jgi:3-oxoacyl-(acyl-carrier-protein) synthase
LTASGLCSRKNDDPAGRISRPLIKTGPAWCLAKGAAVLVLEELEHARARGANILAEIVGYGSTSDAFHTTAPHPEGTGREPRDFPGAGRMPGLNPTDITTSTRTGQPPALNDPMETKAVKRFLAITPTCADEFDQEHDRAWHGRDGGDRSGVLDPGAARPVSRRPPST